MSSMRMLRRHRQADEGESAASRRQTLRLSATSNLVRAGWARWKPVSGDNASNVTSLLYARTGNLRLKKASSHKDSDGRACMEFACTNFGRVS